MIRRRRKVLLMVGNSLFAGVFGDGKDLLVFDGNIVEVTPYSGADERDYFQRAKVLDAYLTVSDEDFDNLRKMEILAKLEFPQEVEDDE